MTQNISNMKINDVAKLIVKESREHLEAIRSMQHDVATQLESVRQMEQRLKARAREAELAAQEAAEASEAAAPAQEPLETSAAPAPIEVQASESVPTPTVAAPPSEVSAPVEAPVVEAAPPVVAAAPEAAPAPQAPAAAPVQESAAAATPAAEAPVRVERPAERLARLRAMQAGQGMQLRDDASIRNAERAAKEAAERAAAGLPPLPVEPQRRPPSDRPQRPQGQQGQQGARPYPPRDGQRPMGGPGQRPAGGGYAPRDGQRPAGPGGQNRPQRPTGAGAAPVAAAPERKSKVSNYDPNKSNYVRVFDTEKKTKSRKAIDRERRALGTDEDTYRRRKRKTQQTVGRPEPVRIEKAVITGDTVMVKTLADRIGKPATDIIKKLMMLGTIVTINHEIDYDTAALVSSDFGVELEQRMAVTAEGTLVAQDDLDNDENLIKRPPVITIMGHVDHGKTSLLDKIRSTRVTDVEAGGITQHIGAYQVECNGHPITFLDTPGHEAFTAMRARGAQVTDAVVLVVAANDGIMPQTVEAINHAKAAGVPIIVAINKMDLPEANPERVKQELTEHELLAEEWGGETMVIPVSAKTGDGIDELLEMILLATDVLELRANPDRAAKGTIVEAKLDKGRGPVATVLVQNGTLRVGQTVVAGTSSGRIRAMLDDSGKKVDQAGPSTPVEVLGFDFVPQAGDLLYSVEDGAITRQVVEERRNRIKIEQMKLSARVSLDDLFEQIKEGQIKDLNIIVKADVQGSVEAVRSSLEKLSNEHVRVRCIHGGAGAITATDVGLASASNAIIIGFNVRPDTPARLAAEKDKVDIRLYRIIYNAIEDIEKAMKGMLEPVFEEVIIGHAQVRETFKASAIGTIAGCMVLDGKMTRNATVRLLRDNVVIYEGHLASLRRFKDDVREVLTGFECGLSLQNYNDIKEGDVIEAYAQQEVEQD